MEALIRKIPNTQGNYSLQTCDENYKVRPLTFKTLNDAILFINDLSNYEAQLKFEGENFIMYQWPTTFEEHKKNYKQAMSKLI